MKINARNGRRLLKKPVIMNFRQIAINCANNYGGNYIQFNTANKVEMSLEIEPEEINKYRETKMGDEKKEDVAFLKRFEVAITKVFDRIQTETEFSRSFCCILLIIAFSQLLSIVFDPALGLHALDSMSWPLTTFATNVGIFGLVLNSGNSNWYYIIAYISCGFLLFYILILGIISKGDCGEAKGNYVGVTRTATNFTALLYWVLLVPIFKIFLGIFQCDSVTKHLQVDSNLTCWSGMHIVHVTLISLFIVLLVTLSMIISLFGNDTNPYNPRNPFSRFNWDFELMFALYRIALPLVSAFLPSGSLRDSLVVWPFGFLSIKALLWYREYYPYYCQAVGIVFGICTHSAVWVSLVLILNTIVTTYIGYIYEGNTLLILVGILGIIPLVYKIHKAQLYWVVLHNKEASLETEEEFNKYISGLISLTIYKKTLEDFDRVILEGCILSHKASCKDPQCPLNNDKDYYLAVTEEKSEATHDNHVLLIHLIQFIYKTMLERNNGGRGIVQTGIAADIWQRSHLSHAYFLIYQIGNLHAAAVELSKIEQSDPSLTLRVAVFKAKTVLAKVYDLNNAKKMYKGKERVTSIDPRLLLEYEAKFNHFKEGILGVAEKYREIWTQLLSPFPDLNVVQRNSEQAVYKNDEINRIWEELCVLHFNYSKAEMTYAMYLSEVLGQEELAEKHMSRYKGIMPTSISLNEQLLADNAIFESDIAVIAMSSMPDSLGNIIKASNGVTKLFEYSPNELVGKSVSLLMPQFIADHHNQFVVSYLESGCRTAVDREFDSFACDKQQYVFQVKILIRQYYDPLYGSVFVALIKAYPPQCLIVTDAEGVILGLSRESSRALGTMFSPVFVKENYVRIQYICPHLAWPLENAEETYETFTGSKEVVFAIPTNLTGALQIQHEEAKGTIKGGLKNIMHGFEYESGVQRKWRCAVINVKHQMIKLKAFFFKGRGRNVVNPSDSSGSGEEYECEIIEKHLEGSEGKSQVGAKDDDSLIIRRPMFSLARFLKPSLKTVRGISRIAPETKSYMKSTEALPVWKEDETTNVQSQSVNKSPQIEEGKNQETEHEAQMRNAYKSEGKGLKQIQRNAILREITLLKGIDYKKYVPPMTKRILRCALLHFVLCILAGSLFFIHMMVSISTLNGNYSIILLEREGNLLHMSDAVRSLLLMGNSIDGRPILDTTLRAKYNFMKQPLPSNVTAFNYTEWKLRTLLKNANDLINSQETINREVVKFYEEKDKESINPSSSSFVTLDFNGSLVMTFAHFSTLVTTLANQAIKITRLPLESISEQSVPVQFMLLNAYQTLAASKYESDSMLNEVVYIQKLTDENIFIAIIIVYGIGVITFILMTSMWKEIVNQGTVSTRLLLKITKHQLKEQIAHCGKFMRFLNAGEGEENDGDYIELEDINQGTDREIAEGATEHDKLVQDEQKRRSETRKRKYQGYKGSTLLFILGFLAIHLLLDGYFFFLYTWPTEFNKNVYSHLKEIIMLRSEYKQHSRLYVLTLEVFRSTAARQVINMPISDMVVQYMANAINSQEDLIKHFTDNKDFYSDAYKHAFTLGMQGNICDPLFGMNTTECYELDNGILGKGLYATNVQYLSRLQDTLKARLSLNPEQLNLEYYRKSVNSHEFIMIELVLRKYHSSVTNTIISFLKESFEKVLKLQSIMIIAIACFTYVLIVLVYMVLWRKYIGHVRDKLLKTKMTLCHIPVNVIVDTVDIRKYFFDTAQEVMANFSKKPIAWVIQQKTFTDQCCNICLQINRDIIVSTQIRKH
eukprot:TRINITY_DN3839_c0_g1_i1.p1 TRINITY_DN3839_c0_g1~~TRINITY_DN3839_c0_g1_i1.p1  ORF type:complete len:1765 (-),score=115.97 TRINITY_DN3839_c0_g1_i1:6161-11455(-)